MMMKDSVVDQNLSNLTSASGEASASSASFLQEQSFINSANQDQPPLKKKRGLPGNPDPDAEVIALSPKTLLATHRFICEICNKGFQRDQNLQLHRRGHNLPWKLKKKTNKDVIRKKVYVCPEPSCVHHDPSRALGDLTGIKKHFCRKHGEKKWKCEKCSKRYAVQSDWKAHSKICGTREYRCDCGTIFSRRDSFITHRAFCDALLEETTRRAKTISEPNSIPQQITPTNFQNQYYQFQTIPLSSFSVKRELLQEHNVNNVPPWLGPPCPNAAIDLSSSSSQLFPVGTSLDHQGNENPSPVATLPPFQTITASAHMSATALLQKAAQMGSTAIPSHNKPSNMSETVGLSSDEQIISYKAATTGQSSLVMPEMAMRSSFVDGSSSSSSTFDLDFSRTVGSHFSDGGVGFTREFLGIEEFSQRGFVGMAGFDHINSSSSSSSTSSKYGLQGQTHAQWHGLI